MYNAQPISLAEVKKLQVELLLFVSRLCREYRLRYFLGYGTLLGAVRHGGFIPWDDDIDIIMPRPDYLRLINIIAEGCFEQIKILAVQNDDDYSYPFAKIIDKRTVLFEDYNEIVKVELGVNIDVFPLDGLPENRFRSYFLFKAIDILRSARFVSVQKFPPSGQNLFKKTGKLVAGFIFKPFGYKRILQLMEKLAVKYDYDCSNYVGSICWGEGFRERTLKNSFDRSVELAFEGYEFPVPSGYETYLKNIYGAYWELPPENERVSRHKWRAYWKTADVERTECGCRQ